ncbi:TetR/AcrR family transcriptional regulator [Streptomyces sp. NPDC056600]|uniref:TetR/AcrR family transcriptional regulator n=1 Tax=Streptomyces sp. NPDC056600 TaxID=3345874 RepID=UPI003681C1FD
MARSERARSALLDAAERLFAQQGIAQVSDRKVAEAAGNSNHSAVGYHFGGREGLLRALVDRHLAEIEERSRVMFDEGSASLLDDVRALVVPVTEVMAELPRPTWRARFFSLALHDPSVSRLMRRTSEVAPTTARIGQSVGARLSHLDPAVVRGRTMLMAHLVNSACAEIEEKAERDGEEPDWPGVGDFLSDAIAGMLLAPVSRPRSAAAGARQAGASGGAGAGREG